MNIYFSKKNLSRFKNIVEQQNVYNRKLRKAWKFIFEYFSQREKLIKALVWIKKIVRN